MDHGVPCQLSCAEGNASTDHAMALAYLSREMLRSVNQGPMVKRGRQIGWTTSDG